MKIIKIAIFLGICYSATIGGSDNAIAQNLIVKSTHGDWVIQCRYLGNPTVDAADLVKQMEGKAVVDKTRQNCQLSQQVRSSTNARMGLKIALLKVPVKDKPDGVVLQILAPLGIFLPSGLALEIDSVAKGKIQFLNCLSSGCLAQSPVTDDLLKSLKQGGIANFIVYQAPGRGLPIPVSLKGFTAGYKAMLEL